jgi:hypothetical protein
VENLEEGRVRLLPQQPTGLQLRLSASRPQLLRAERRATALRGIEPLRELSQPVSRRTKSRSYPAPRVDCRLDALLRDHQRLGHKGRFVALTPVNRLQTPVIGNWPRRAVGRQMPCKAALFERSGRPNRTQEVGGSSPPSSIARKPHEQAVPCFRRSRPVARLLATWLEYPVGPWLESRLRHGAGFGSVEPLPGR